MAIAQSEHGGYQIFPKTNNPNGHDKGEGVGCPNPNISNPREWGFFNLSRHCGTIVRRYTMKPKVRTLKTCDHCYGDAYLPDRKDISNNGEEYMRYKP